VVCRSLRHSPPRAAQLLSGTTTNQQVDGHPLLTPAQEEVLSKVGIDPALIPREITPEQERCLTETLTPTRVEELLAGDLPTIPEIGAARSCFTSPLD
jgi:hypothetical protein